MKVATNTDSKLVAFQNDVFRLTTHAIRLSKGVYALPDLDGLVKQVRYFSKFSIKNDPYQEHDFGFINWQGAEVYWRIDYFDPSLAFWANPLSPDCRRILTVFLASEY